MVINQGDIFWVDLGEPSDSEPGYRRPHVVIQNNVFNRSRINSKKVLRHFKFAPKSLLVTYPKLSKADLFVSV